MSVMQEKERWMDDADERGGKGEVEWQESVFSR